MYFSLTFALTFSKEAGLTNEKQIRNTSCEEQEGNVNYKTMNKSHTHDTVTKISSAKTQ